MGYSAAVFSFPILGLFPVSDTLTVLSALSLKLSSPYISLKFMQPTFQYLKNLQPLAELHIQGHSFTISSLAMKVEWNWAVILPVPT